MLPSEGLPNLPLCSPETSQKTPQNFMIAATLLCLIVGISDGDTLTAREQLAQERGQYEFAEQEARARRVGLWQDTEPMAQAHTGAASNTLKQTI